MARHRVTKHYQRWHKQCNSVNVSKRRQFNEKPAAKTSGAQQISIGMPHLSNVCENGVSSSKKAASAANMARS